jgi:hypothetical protein
MIELNCGKRKVEIVTTILRNGSEKTVTPAYFEKVQLDLHLTSAAQHKVLQCRTDGSKQIRTYA